MAERAHALRIGVVLNPVAGVGGPAALRGSDGASIQREARERGALPHAAERLRAVLAAVPAPRTARWYAWGAPMGADVLDALGIGCTVLGLPDAAATCAADTVRAVRAFVRTGVELVLFAGGDGTARDVCDALRALPAPPLCLGVPAGVKMHSSVFALTPHAAGEVLRRLIDGELVQVHDGEVRDIDEAALRAGRIDNRYFGSLRVPRAAAFMQHLKQGGRESEPLAQEEAAAGAVALIQAPEHAGTCWLLGPGSTLLAVKRQLGFEGTLLGVDAWCDGTVLARDADEARLVALCAQPAREEGARVCLALSPTQRQGSLLGRGNQQLSPRVLRACAWPPMIVATRGKLAALAGRPLFVDTGDPDLDARLCGLVEVVCGYEERLAYRIATA